MDITYLGHSSFKLRGRTASLVTDPFDKTGVGLLFPKTSADIITVSHQHQDHNQVEKVAGTARRQEPLVIEAPGEYEAMEVSVFGITSFHDKQKGAERGRNTIFVIFIDTVTVVHLGDLGQKLTDRQVEEIGEVDVLLAPVGGVYTLDAREILEVSSQLQPKILIPMHFKAAGMNQEIFGKLATLDDFLKEAGQEEITAMDKLTVRKATLPEEMEIIVLKKV